MRRRFRAVGLCLLVGLGSLAGAAIAEEDEREPGPDDLGRNEAGALVAGAASCSRDALQGLLRESGPSLSKMAEHEDGIPFTLAAVLASLDSVPDMKDLSFSPDVTPRALSRALDPLENRMPKYKRPSLIHVEYVRGVVVAMDGADRAKGAVRFAAPDTYEGSVTFEAARVKGRWIVVSLRMEAPLIHVTSEDGRKFEMLHPRPKDRVNPRRGRDLRLPVLSLVGKEPPEKERVLISVTKRGELYVSGVKGVVSLHGLHAHLVGATQDPATRQPDGSSKLTALLDVDRSVPWNICQWIMQVCADPQVKIYKIAFGARARGSLAAGAVVVPLPTGSTNPQVGTFRKVKAKVFSRGVGASDPHLLYPALLTLPQGDRVGSVLEIVAPPPKGGRVPWGYIAQLIDAGVRTGFGQIVFEGSAMPRIQGGLLPADPAWLPGQIAQIRQAAVGESTRMKLDNSGWIDELGLKPKAPPPAGRVEEEISCPVVEAHRVDDVVESPDALREMLTDGGPSGPRRPVFEARGSRPTGGAVTARHKAAQEALRWLASHQSPNGGWEAAGFGAWCDGKPVTAAGKRPGGEGKKLYDVGVTGLALQAFLAAGYTNRGKHPFAKVVSKGLRYLKNVQDPDGCFGPRSTQQYVYNHAMAAIAMVEAYGMTGSPIFKGSAQRCLDFIALARNPYFVWRYGIKPGDNDTSVTSWMTLALRVGAWINQDAAKRGKQAPLTIDQSAFDGVRAWLSKVTDPSYGRVGYVSRGTGPARPQALVDKFPGEKSESMTAAAIFSRCLIGEDPRRAGNILNGLKLLGGLRPKWNPRDGSIDMYYWYWGTLACRQAGGEHWALWVKALDEALLKHQRKDGDFCVYRGSFDPAGPWGPDGGRVYSTALMCLTLLADVRYPRVFGK